MPVGLERGYILADESLKCCQGIATGIDRREVLREGGGADELTLEGEVECQPPCGEIRAIGERFLVGMCGHEGLFPRTKQVGYRHEFAFCFPVENLLQAVAVGVTDAEFAAIENRRLEDLREAFVQPARQFAGAFPGLHVVDAQWRVNGVGRVGVERFVIQNREQLRGGGIEPRIVFALGGQHFLTLIDDG